MDEFYEREEEVGRLVAVRELAKALAVAERDAASLREAVRPLLVSPRYMSIGAIDNTVEIRVSAAKFKRAEEAVR